MKDNAGNSGEIRVDRAESDLGIEATKAEDVMTSPVWHVGRRRTSKRSRRSLRIETSRECPSSTLMETFSG